jgi:hypothetical protein
MEAVKESRVVKDYTLTKFSWYLTKKAPILLAGDIEEVPC